MHSIGVEASSLLFLGLLQACFGVGPFFSKQSAT